MDVFDAKLDVIDAGRSNNITSTLAYMLVGLAAPHKPSPTFGLSIINPSDTTYNVHSVVGIIKLFYAQTHLVARYQETSYDAARNVTQPLICP